MSSAISNIKIPNVDTPYEIKAMQIAFNGAATNSRTQIEVTIPGTLSLTKGTMIGVRFKNEVYADGELNINGLGYKPIVYKNKNIIRGKILNNSVHLFIYDTPTSYPDGCWQLINHVKANEGFAYGSSTNGANTVAKTANSAGYSAELYGIVAIRFSTRVPANGTLNVNATGAYPIYHRNAAILADVIQAGDTATFIFDGSYYRLLSIDRLDASSGGSSGTEVGANATQIPMSATDSTSIADAMGEKADVVHNHYATDILMSEENDISLNDAINERAYAEHTHNYAGSSTPGGAATSANKVNKAVTFNNGGSGASSGTTFDGSVAKTISYNTVGAAAANHNHNSDYAPINHNHDSNYAAIDHNHSGVYAEEEHTHNYAGSSTPGGAATTASKLNHSLTFNDAGTGSASGVTFNGANARTISYNTIGAAPTNHTHNEYAPVEHTHTGYAPTEHTHEEYVPYSGGTMTGALVAANTATNTRAMRNILAGTEEVAVTLAEGDIYIQYI